MSEQEQNVTPKETATKVPEVSNKKGMGIIFGLFTGLLGLLIGWLIYKDNEYQKSTFIKGWIIGFLIELGVAIVLTIIIVASSASIANNAINEATDMIDRFQAYIMR